MGVVQCPDCGGTVSERAIACPHCGAPTANDIAVATKPSKPIDPRAELCLSCHSIVHGQEKAKGPAWLGCLLMVAYIIPGIVYFVWRSVTKERVCPNCGAAALVPASSQRAAEILGKASRPAVGDSTEEELICPSCMLPLSFPAGRQRAKCPHCTTIVRRTASGGIVEDEGQ